MLVTLPTKEIPEDLDLQEGQRVRLGNGAEATVHKRTDEGVTIDANHILAGKTLHFDVELMDLTKVRLTIWQAQLLLYDSADQLVK